MESALSVMGRRDKWDERLEKVDVLRARDLDPTPGPWQRDGSAPVVEAVARLRDQSAA